MNFATALQALKDDRAAMTVLERLIVDHPLCAQAHEALIEAYQSQERPAEAERARREWVAMDADSVPARRILAVQAIAEQQKDEAHHILLELFNRDSSNAETLATIVAYDASGADWITTLRAKFDHEHWNYSLGEALIEMLHTRSTDADAVQIADAVREAVSKDSGSALQACRGLYTRLGANEQSESVLEQIITIDPDFAGPHATIWAIPG